MTQVFVSYAREDHRAALPIIEAISEAGLTVWHSDAILPGDTVMREVRRALDTAQCVVVLWSEAAAQSRLLQQELHRVIQAWSSDRLVLAALDDGPLPLGLRDLLPISVRGASGPGVKQLIKRARAIIRQGALARSPNSSGLTPAPHPVQSVRRRRSAAIVAALLIVGFA